MPRLPIVCLFVGLLAAGLLAQTAPSSGFIGVDDIKPGMTGVSRTVFAGEDLEDFRVTVLGVLKNVMGPGRSLILARLEGGPLANTGVIAGMSGSPVYFDGKLAGAISYSLGSFPKEPIAGITPIGEMTDAVDTNGPRTNSRALELDWPASPAAVMAALGRLASRAAAPIGSAEPFAVVGAPALADLAPALRPIAVSMVLGGFDPSTERDLRDALAPSASIAQTRTTSAGPSPSAPLRGGDPIGVSLIHGDLEMGATGTVTYVDGPRVYAFGHPFLNLGSTRFPMTRAHVYTVLPSLESSMKIASLGPVIGTISQDRATAVGGTLGAMPHELDVHVAMTSDKGPARRFTFSILQDEALTPLLAYVALNNSLTAYERQTGALTVSVKGTVSFGTDGAVAIDDVFSGDTAVPNASAVVASPVGAAMGNDFRDVIPERIDVEFHASERQQSATIERVWLDTVNPRLGSSHIVQVQLQDYRGDKQVLAIPITMPTHADGPLTLLVSDAPTLTTLEGKELDPAKPANWTELVAALNKTRRNNRIYVRLIASSRGSVVSGETLPALPASIRGVLDADTGVNRASVAKTTVGQWEQRVDTVVRGSRELTISLQPQ